jgi:hypothetical protein
MKMSNEDQEEMWLHFTLIDAAELAHKIGYAEWMELFQLAFLRMKPESKPLTEEERKAQIELLNNWEL